LIDSETGQRLEYLETEKDEQDLIEAETVRRDEGIIVDTIED
jgi:hypothetical protein